MFKRSATLDDNDSAHTLDFSRLEKKHSPQPTSSIPHTGTARAREVQVLIIDSGLPGPERPREGDVRYRGFFSATAANVRLGRVITESDNRPDGQAVVVLSDDAWRSRLASEPDIIGRAMVIDGVSRTVVGVLPPGFPVITHEELYIPLVITRDDSLCTHLKLVDALGRA